MDTALWKLYRLRMRGSLRAIVGKLKTVRGAALALFTLLVFGMMFGPNLVMALVHRPQPAMTPVADGFREFISAGLFLYCLLTIGTSQGERVIYFSPAEIDFLFPGPFSRRQLLLYRILGSLNGAVFIALIMPMAFTLHVRCWPAAVVGFFLAWLLLHSLTMCVQLVAETVSERAFTRTRRLLLWGFLAIGALAIGLAARQGIGEHWLENLKQIRHMPVVVVLLAPFEVYARVITAERLFPDALGWAALGTILVIGLYALAIRLDANYLETAVRVSQKVQQRRRRASTEGVFAYQAKRPVASTRLPHLPWLGGIGPLVWRQVVQSFRGHRGVFLLVAFILLPMVISTLIGSVGSTDLFKRLPQIVIGAAAYMTLIWSAQSPLGFRSDYERMDLLKSLPIRPLAMAGGQILGVTLLLTLLDWTVFGVVAIALPSSAVEMGLAGLFALPVNWLFFGLEDFFFLLYPSAPVAAGSEGFLKVGRRMLTMMVKVLVLTLCAVIAAIPAVPVYLVTESLLATALVAWCATLLPALGLLPLVAWAFQRYDVSVGGQSE
jgi:hypothetical protein